MGQFLAMSAVVGRDSAAVEQALATIVQDAKGTFASAPGRQGGRDTAIVAAYKVGTVVVYPDGFTDWDDTSKRLSAIMQAAVFSFHIHDGDLWMFLLFDKGEKVAQFNTLPDYWGEDIDPAEWLPDPRVVAATAGDADPEKLASYLRHWDDDLIESGDKAQPEDEFAYGTDWQVVDFMRQMGFGYPIRDDGGTNGATYRFRLQRQ
jgi:hypothetical protein